MRTLLGISMGMIALLLASQSFAEETTLEAGDPAPDFHLVDAQGKEYNLEQFRGKQGVILAWFPRAFTPGCTAEIKSIRDSKAGIDAFDVAYYMVSLDTADRNAEFAEAHECDFPVLSDPTGETAQAYGVGAPGGVFAKRWTYYIDQEGIIREVDRGVKVVTHGADIVARLENLGFPKKEAASEGSP